MDSKDQIDSTGNQHGDQHSPDKSDNNEIPLWLQGLEEPSPDSSGVEPESDWLKEESPGDIPLPDENDEQYGQEIQEPEFMDSEESEEEIKVPEEQNSPIPSYDLGDDAKDTDYEAVPNEEGFVEISEYDHGIEQTHQPDDSMLSDDEELPEWLHEMIAETPVITPEELIQPVVEEVEEIVDEPTEPMKIPQETVVEVEEEEVEEEEIELPEEPPESLEESPVIEPDLPEIVEEPAAESSLEIEPEPEEEEEQEEEQGIPRMLTFAKYLLDEGDTERAVEIFTSFMGQALYREQIKAWLTECTQQDKKVEDSAIWESLGDIAMQDGDSEQAFNAYTKAIQILVTSSRDADEID